MRVLITGGLGFIGSNFINYWLSKYPDDEIVNVDKVTYAANFKNILNPENKRYRFVKADINEEDIIDNIIAQSDLVINFAAESHVDTSISSPAPFLRSNYLGVFKLLELTRKHDKRFHQISTDEVYGSLGLNSADRFNEASRYSPRNPYAATKAAADLLIQAYYNTYGLPVTTSNCSNNFGPNQHPEKLIPKSIMNALNNQSIPLYGDGQQVRDWIFVEDHCAAIDLIVAKGKIGKTYLISAGNERRNIDVVKEILSILGRAQKLMLLVRDRPGHDVRYALQPSQLLIEMGWKPKYTFEEALRATVTHYVHNLSKYQYYHDTEPAKPLTGDK